MGLLSSGQMDEVTEIIADSLAANLRSTTWLYSELRTDVANADGWLDTKMDTVSTFQAALSATGQSQSTQNVRLMGWLMWKSRWDNEVAAAVASANGDKTTVAEETAMQYARDYTVATWLYSQLKTDVSNGDTYIKDTAEALSGGGALYSSLSATGQAQSHLNRQELGWQIWKKRWEENV